MLDPDGGVALVTTKREEPGVTMEARYGDPTEASWAAAFRASRAAHHATTLPPTVPRRRRRRRSRRRACPSPPPPARATRPARRGLSARAAVAGDTCTNGQYALWLGAWTSRNYGYQSVGSHESGHSIGLHQANTSDALTMVYAVCAGTTHARSLGKGDVMGLRTRYP